MTLSQWFIFFLVIQFIHGLGTWKLYIKAGRKAWEAFVPVYNAVVLMRIINRPWWWTILLFVPIVNLIMFPVVWVETARSFGKNTTTDTVLAVLTLGFYNYYLNYAVDVSYIKDRSLHPKSGAGDWVSSILFAIVAATIVHTYFIQPFTIPTSSLEKTLLVGDFLFVSKFHYGARLPMTTVAAPMVHDTIPVIKKKSYLSYPELPYMRLPGFQKIKQNDIVVFNWPVDTMMDMRHTDKYYYKPIDKKTNYVKRCVGLPGDSLSIKDGYVYINGKQNELNDRARIQFSYNITFKGQINSTQQVYDILERFDMTDGLGYDQATDTYIIPAATEEAVAKAKNHPNIASIEIRKDSIGKRDSRIFPMDASYNWNNDNFGPLYIPQAGKTIDLTVENLPLYKHIIKAYEGHTVSVKGNQISIDGKVATTYTFAKDYYWMMGDNRHNSQDSRVWGFVPFDHVVGKPVFIWMSWNGKQPRWERFFTTVGGDGKPSSMFLPFIVLLIAFLFINKWWKKYNEKNKALNKTTQTITGYEYASISDRIKAVMIDSIILIIVMYGVSEFFTLFDSVPNYIKIIVTVVIFLLYDPLFTSFNGGTIGHSVAKIGVRNDDETNTYISFPWAIIRFIFKALLGWISLLTVSGNEKKKAIHDSIVKSIVIRKKD